MKPTEDCNGTANGHVGNGRGSSTALSSLASSCGLIFEQRPCELPPKPQHEHDRHVREHRSILARARRREEQEHAAQKKLEKRRLEHEDWVAKAARTWSQVILPNWSEMASTKRTHDLWWQGLPPCVRGRVWKLALGNTLMLKEQQYYSLSQNAESQLGPSAWEVIGLDAGRTLPQLGVFRTGAPLHMPLCRVLATYALLKPEVGYVQGMAFLAATLLLNLDEADTFVSLANLLQRPLLNALFRMQAGSLSSYCSSFESLLSGMRPKLSSHFHGLGLGAHLFLPDWLFSLFARPLPPDLACRIWDVFLRDGDSFLCRTALGLLSVLEEKLLEEDDLAAAAQLLARPPDDLTSDDLFVAIGKIRLDLETLPVALCPVLVDDARV